MDISAKVRASVDQLLDQVKPTPTLTSDAVQLLAVALEVLRRKRSHRHVVSSTTILVAAVDWSTSLEGGILPPQAIKNMGGELVDDRNFTKLRDDFFARADAQIEAVRDTEEPVLSATVADLLSHSAEVSSTRLLLDVLSNAESNPESWLGRRIRQYSIDANRLMAGLAADDILGTDDVKSEDGRTPIRERVVEVTADLGEGRYRYASGLLIGDRDLITTASAVRGAVGVTAKRSDKQLLSVSWPDRALVGDNDDFDVALLGVADIEPLAPLQIARIDRDVPSGEQLIEGCWVVGFPKFHESTARDGTPAREAAHLVGVVSPLSQGQLLSFRVTEGLRPSDSGSSESTWSGLSGATVFAEEQMIGVVAYHTPGLGVGVDDLVFTPLDRILMAHQAPIDAQSWQRRLQDIGVVFGDPINAGDPFGRPQSEEDVNSQASRTQTDLGGDAGERTDRSTGALDETPATVEEQTETRHDVATDDDDLNRTPLAQDLDARLRALTEGEQGHDPFAVQVQGPWGSGKTSLVKLLLKQATDWHPIWYDAWRESQVAPTWWSLARTVRDGVVETRSALFRPAFRAIEGFARARRTLPRLLLLVAVVVPVVWATITLEQVSDLLRNITGIAVIASLALAANRFLFWDSAAGARLHERTEASPLDDVASHVAWLRRYSARPRLAGWKPTAWRLAAAVWLLLGVVATATSLRDLEPGTWSPATWTMRALPLVVAVAMGALGAADIRSRRSSPPQGNEKSEGASSGDEIRTPAKAAEVEVGELGLGWILVAALAAAVVSSPQVRAVSPRVLWAIFVALGIVLGLSARPLAARWFGQPKQSLLLIVDDLDRCSGPQVVEILSSIQTLMRRSDPSLRRWQRPAPLVFLVLADSKWVTAAFEQEFGEFTDTVGDAGRPLGYLFLDKIFQLTVTVPSIPSDLLRRFLSENAGVPVEPGTAPDVGGSPTAIRGEHLAEPPEAAAMTPDEVSTRIDEATHDDALYAPEVQAAIARQSADVRERLGVAQVRRSHSPELKEATEHFLTKYHHYLDARDPRSVKRLVNTWGVNRALVYSCLNVPRTKGRNDALVRWTILGLRWPALAAVLRESPDQLVELIEPSFRRLAGADLSSRADPTFARLIQQQGALDVLWDTDGRLQADDVRLFTGLIEDH